MQSILNDTAVDPNTDIRKEFNASGPARPEPGASLHILHPTPATIVLSNPFAVPVVLFGYGDWCKKSWVPVLLSLARWGVVTLTVVDRWPVAPSDLSTLEKENALSYLSWESYVKEAAPRPWKVAFVVTSATAHAQVILHTLKHTPSARVIICEKPCGDSLEEANQIADACLDNAVTLLMADHYLLRPPVQHLLVEPQLLRSIGDIVQITCVMNEASATGPNQGVRKDMLVHLIDILIAVFPGAQFTPRSAHVARVADNGHTEQETYACAAGTLAVEDRQVPCYLECGKQLGEDRKEVLIIGTEGELHLDLIANALLVTRNNGDPKEVCLKWSRGWSYAQLVLSSLQLSSLDSGHYRPE